MTKKLEAKVSFKADDNFSAIVSKMEKSVDGLVSGIKKATRHTDKLAKTESKFSGLISKLNTASKHARTLAGYIGKGFAVALGSAGVAAGYMLKSFSQIEDAAAAFEPLMGGAEGAAKLVDALNETAATTPFQFEQLSEVAKLFLPSVGGSIKDTIKYTRMLGDATGGNAEKFKSASVAMAKLMMTGKATQEHLGSFVIAGIPIYKELSEMLGVSQKKLEKMVRGGKVSAATMTKVFEKMTSSGGIFYRGMDIASRTLTGKISTLKDNLKLLAAGIGKILNPVAKQLTDYLIGVVQRGRDWIKANEELIRSKFMSFVKKIPQYFEQTVRIGKMLVKTIIGIASAINNIVLEPIEKLQSLIRGLTSDTDETNVQFSHLGKIISDNFGDAWKAISRFADAITMTNREVEKVGSGISTLMRVLSGVLSTYIPVLTGFFTSFLNVVSNIVENIQSSVGGLFKGLIDIMEGNFLKGISRIGIAMFNALTAPIRVAISLVVDLLKKLGADMIAFKLGIDLDGIQNALDKGLKYEHFAGPETDTQNIVNKATSQADKVVRKSQDMVGGTQGSQTSNVTGQATKNTTTHTEKVELVIKDESGRAEIDSTTQSKNKNIKLKLVHTGAM